MNDDPLQPAARIPLSGRAWVPRDAIEWSFARASGPGGQCVNKIASAATLRVPVAEIRGLDDAARERLRGLAGGRLGRDDVIRFRAQVHRSQRDNRRACLERLSAMVGEAIVVPKKRKASRPGRGAVERRLEQKRVRASAKSRRRWRPDE